MKKLIYELLLLAQAANIVACEKVGLPTIKIKRKMVCTRTKLRRSNVYKKRAFNRRLMRK